MMILLALSLAILPAADEAYLLEQATQVVAEARLTPGQSSGKWRNETPYTLRVPGGNMGYPAFWVRDAVMMLGAHLVPAGEIEGWIRLMASTLRDRDWEVRPGVVVPAHAVPDHINFDGKPTFYPGNLETGARQGGPPFGKYPPLDDHFYFLTAIYEHWKLTHNIGVFRSLGFVLLKRIYAVAASDPATGLVEAGDVDTENAKDWGFCDTVFKSGKLLFPSILKYRAAGQLSELFEAAGETGEARYYRREAARLRRAIVRTFLNPDGWLHSATGVGNQPDVWGSAFAVWAGAVGDDTARQVARTLVRAYRDGQVVRQGCVRHLPKGEWEKCIAKPDTYQNGGYWGTPSGWYIAAMHRVDPKAAREMAVDYIQFLRQSEQWEWFHPGTGRHANPRYVATVALPYISLLQAGLIARPVIASR